MVLERFSKGDSAGDSDDRAIPIELSLRESMGKTSERLAVGIGRTVTDDQGEHGEVRTGFASSGLVFLLFVMALLSPMSTLRGGDLAAAPVKNEDLAFPTSPFYNPGPCDSCTTSFHYFAKNYSGIQTESASIGSCGGVCNGLFSVSAGTMYDPVGMLAESSVYNDCIGVVCGISLATWSLKLPSGIADACVPNLPTTGTESSPCADVRGFDLSGTITGAVGGILLTSATPVGDPTCTHFLGATPDKGNTPANACWTADYQIVQAGQSINPPCIEGVT
ncbi:MAG TPA: hypothetical protein VFE96_09790, partial [Candidatus Bathyarchaeia archaeon]|nr:hypothetical protein [Candidatus Bathyarchaeia archaeon]